MMAENKIKYPIAIELVISEENLKKCKDQPGEFIASEFFEPFNNSDIEYNIFICPNDYDHKGEAWIYFEIDRTEKSKLEANINFRIKSANFNSEGNDDFEESEWLQIKLCSTEELFDPENKYIVDGKMTIKMDGFLLIESDGEKEKKWKYKKSSDSLCLNLWKQENKEFTIVVDGKEITAHKCVLSARSPVFSKMFESGMKEAQENKVKITDFSFDVVETAVKLCYHHSLITSISLDDKMKLLQFFDKYDIQELKDHLQNYLITVINELTVCRLVNASLISNAQKLEEKCAEFLQSCFKTKPIADFDLLDKDFALNFLKNSFCHVSNV